MRPGAPQPCLHDLGANHFAWFSAGAGPPVPTEPVWSSPPLVLQTRKLKLREAVCSVIMTTAKVCSPLLAPSPAPSTSPATWQNRTFTPYRTCRGEAGDGRHRHTMAAGLEASPCSSSNQGNSSGFPLGHTLASVSLSYWVKGQRGGPQRPV